MDHDLPPFPSGQVARVSADLILRPAEDNDFDFLRRLYADWMTTRFDALPWDATQKRTMIESQFRAQHFQFVERYGAVDFWIVTDADGRAMGRLYLDRSRSEWRMIDLMLNDADRGRGVGGALIAWIQREATAAGASLMLHVALDNPRARALYLQYGFVDHASDEPMHRAMRWCGI